MRIQTLLIVLPLLLSRGHCDIAPEPMSGGISLTVPGKTQTNIILIHNTVKMEISSSQCKTRAFFRLHNTGEAIELEIGFPLIRDQKVNDFTVFVDKQRYAHQERSIEVKTPIGQTYTQHWKVWPVMFKAGQTRLIEVRYSNPTPAGYSLKMPPTFPGYSFYSHWRRTGLDYDLADYGYEESAKLHDLVAIKRVRYILVTGSFWKGPIARCRVEASIANLPTDSLVGFRPLPHSFSAQKVVWEWKDVEPSRNVDIVFLGGSPSRVVIPYLKKISQAHPTDESVKATLAEINKDFSPDKITQRQKEFVQTLPAD